MKTIGLGGMSWESTVSYYQTINRCVSTRLGGFHSAKILLNSVDFAPVEKAQRENRWDDAGQVVADAAGALERGGADFLVIGCNTMHRAADRIESSVNLPLLHIADATADEVIARGMERVGFLGTRFTMQEDFIRGRLERRNLTVEIPKSGECEIIHRVIYEELIAGHLSDLSRTEYVQIVERLSANGCEGVVLGCTEVGMLIGPADTQVPLFDTAEIHAERAATYALEDGT